MRIIKTYAGQKRLILMDAEEWAAFSAAVVIAFDTLPPETPPEMAEAAGRLWRATQGGSAEDCPGCGAKPGEGINPRCDNPQGCGHHREVERLWNRDVPVTIRREGRFKALVPSPKQCGGVGQKEFSFEARVTVDARTLDGRGFIVEHDVIQAWFDEEWKEKEAISCERMAIHAAKSLSDLVGRRLRKDPLEVVVTVAGSEVSRATATVWNGEVGEYSTT